MNTDDCKGCLLHENYCTIKKSPNIINCPCQNCIIKMICKIECQDHMDCIDICVKENNP